MTATLASLVSLGPPVRMPTRQVYTPAWPWSAERRLSVLFHRSL